ncbi:MAG TPA: response regulator transcription factor [Vicinamibacterales bacterium]|nr:response regulator transcription factor [Vicinamibacterales bacterium]
MGTRVLCVDDDPATQVVLSGIIEDAGWQSELALNATVARQTLEANPDIQVVLLDWMLPDGSGVDLCRELKAVAGASLYVILVTVRGEPEDVETGLDAGADDYLVKPVSPVEVRARVRSGFRAAEAQRQLAERLAQLEQALKRVSNLESLLPLCMYCRRINSSEMWQSVEDYLWEHVDVKVSHGCCPDCLSKLTRQLGEG